MLAPPATPEKPRILVADDDHLIRTLAQDSLEAAGFAVEAVPNGVEALARFERLHPSLVILDVHMPELDGLAACTELRRRYGTEGTPILVVTSAEDPEAVDRAFRAGATDFVHKPIHWPLLGHRVRYLLRASQAFADLRRSQMSLARAQRLARLGSWEWDPETGDMCWSDETFRILGLEPGPPGAGLEALFRCVHPADREFLRERIQEARELVKSFDVEHRLLLPDGSVRFVQQQGEVVQSDLPGGSRVCGTLQDVTVAVLAQEKMRRLANYDSLTGLANRWLFRERLERAIAAARFRGNLVGLLYIDLDRFKDVNDTLGHGAGDEILKVVGDRLLEHVRGSDIVGRVDTTDPSPSVSRLGGDEFTVLLSRIACLEDAADVARRILRTLPQSIPVGGHEVSTSASIGIAIYPLDGEDAETLIKSADAAMYHAKESGRGNHQFFTEAMNAVSLRKLALESRLREALERQELRLHYQPRVDLRTGRVVGVEALLRWNHPDLGVVAPDEFIPLSEETGLIVPIGEWVLRTACAQGRAWRDAGYGRVRMSVNVSTRQFLHRDMARIVNEALAQSGLAPGDLEIDLTESLMLEEDAAAPVFLRHLRRLGVRIALDDFGTGFSSLSHLARFPLDTLKLDRRFVRDVARDPRAAGVATAVITMAKSLDLRVVAEGVEVQEQAQFLREHGCDEMQGFLVSPALPPEDLVRFLAAGEDPQLS